MAHLIQNILSILYSRREIKQGGITKNRIDSLQQGKEEKDE